MSMVSSAAVQACMSHLIPEWTEWCRRFPQRQYKHARTTFFFKCDIVFLLDSRLCGCFPSDLVSQNFQHPFWTTHSRWPRFLFALFYCFVAGGMIWCMNLKLLCKNHKKNKATISPNWCGEPGAVTPKGTTYWQYDTTVTVFFWKHDQQEACWSQWDSNSLWEKPTSSQFLGLHVFAQNYSRILNTLPESNKAPENGPGSKETSFPAINFQVLVSGRVWFFHIQWGHNPYIMGNWDEKTLLIGVPTL